MTPPSLASSAVIGAPFLALCAGSALLLTDAGMIACRIMGLGRGDRGLLIRCALKKPRPIPPGSPPEGHFPPSLARLSA